jgi:hypothetical protein
VPIYLPVADGYLFSLTRRFTILSKAGDVVCAVQPPVPEFCCAKFLAGTRQIAKWAAMRQPIIDWITGSPLWVGDSAPSMARNERERWRARHRLWSGYSLRRDPA